MSQRGNRSMAAWQKLRFGGNESMENPFRVRSATPADVPAVAAIEQTVFADPWSASAFHAMLGPHSLVAVSDGEIDGYVFARSMADKGEVLNVAVLQGQRRRGLGRLLLETVLENFRKKGVQTV